MNNNWFYEGVVLRKTGKTGCILNEDTTCQLKGSL